MCHSTFTLQLHHNESESPKDPTVRVLVVFLAFSEFRTIFILFLNSFGSAESFPLMYPVYQGSGGGRMSNFQNNPSPHGGTPVSQPSPMNPGIQMGSPLPLPQPGSATPQGSNNRNQMQQPMRGSPTPYMNPKASSTPSSNSRESRANTTTMAGEAISEVFDSEVKNKYRFTSWIFP